MSDYTTEELLSFDDDLIIVNEPVEPLTREDIIFHYQSLFREFNEKYFNNELPHAEITCLKDDGKELPEKFKDVTALFVVNKRGKAFIIMEMSNDPDTWLIGDKALSLFHEMIHYYCYLHNIRDMEPDWYHNANFKKAAEDHGGVAEWIDNKRGYDVVDFAINW